MNCEQIREQLIETARGRELSSDLRAIVFDHAALCAECAMRLENERQLSTALGHLASQTQGAPARLETLILRKPRIRPTVWAGAMALAASLLVGAILLRRPAPPVAPVQTEVNLSDADTADTADFVPLPYAEAIAPDEATETVRVQLARESLQAMGVPISDNRPGDEIQADLLLGMDGTPRAIRITN